MKTTDNEAKKPTTPEGRRIARKAQKEHRARVRLVINTYERVIHLFARSGHLVRCQAMAADMMELAKEKPEDFGRWKNVQVQVTSPPETPPS
jgi:hypothetical protein